ncbi:hypothetical protein HYU40_00670 [Candidatus Woesearchaeota archaeon]|nr:hypothetical protein [Candidatus Woesearchaeota archaeon]
MAGTALEEIRQAEKEADRIIEDAGRRKEAVISEARAKAAQFLKDKEKELAKGKASSMENLKEKLLAARSKVLSEGSEKVKVLRKSGEKKVSEAAELALEAFENEISRP